MAVGFVSSSLTTLNPFLAPISEQVFHVVLSATTAEAEAAVGGNIGALFLERRRRGRRQADPAAAAAVFEKLIVSCRAIGGFKSADISG